MMDNTAVEHCSGGMTLTGDAIELYRWATLLQAIKLYQKIGMIPTRGVTIAVMLKQAAVITKPVKAYTTGKGVQQAIDDLTNYVQTLRAAIPHVDGKTGKQL